MKMAWVLIPFGVTTAPAQEPLKINDPVHQLGSGAVQTYTLELKPGDYVDGLLALDDPQYASAVAQLDRGRCAAPAGRLFVSGLAGRTWNLKELRGNVVLVNFWATWCPPCRSEMRDLQGLLLPV